MAIRSIPFTLVLMAALMPASAPVLAAPSDYTRIVTAPGRLADNIALDADRKPADILDFAGFDAGDTIVDLFPGGGYYTELLARVVGPRGTVIALYPDSFMALPANQTLWAGLRQRIPTIQMMTIDLRGLALAPASIDGMMLHMVYHDLYWTSARFKFPTQDVDALLANWYRAIRPGGAVVIVDHVGRAGDTRALADAVHRIDPAVVRRDMERAGFVFDGSSDVLINAVDNPDVLVFDEAVRGKTSRFAYRFRKPG